MIANLETVSRNVRFFITISFSLSQFTEIHVYNYSKLIDESQFFFQFEFENEPVNQFNKAHSYEQWTVKI